MVQPKAWGLQKELWMITQLLDWWRPGLSDVSDTETFEDQLVKESDVRRRLLQEGAVDTRNVKDLMLLRDAAMAGVSRLCGVDILPATRVVDAAEALARRRT